MYKLTVVHSQIEALNNLDQVAHTDRYLIEDLIANILDPILIQWERATNDLTNTDYWFFVNSNTAMFISEM